MFMKFAVLAVLASVAYAVNLQRYNYDTTQERPEGTSKNEKGCYIHDLGENGTVIPFDITLDKYYPDNGECEYYTCEEETWNAYRFRCNTVQKKKGCKIVEGDKSKKYPACCDQLVCDDAEDNKQ